MQLKRPFSDFSLGRTYWMVCVYIQDDFFFFARLTLVKCPLGGAQWEKSSGKWSYFFSEHSSASLQKSESISLENKGQYDNEETVDLSYVNNACDFGTTVNGCRLRAPEREWEPYWKIIAISFLVQWMNAWMKHFYNAVNRIAMRRYFLVHWFFSFPFCFFDFFMRKMRPHTVSSHVLLNTFKYKLEKKNAY